MMLNIFKSRKILPFKDNKPAEKEKEKCYICLDNCNKKSPCKCNSYIHTACLIKTKIRWNTNTT